MKSKIQYLGWVSACVFSVAIFFVLAKLQPEPVILDYGSVPSFSLTDANSNEFNLSSMKGRPWIVSFLFTRCRGQCPMMIGKLQKISAEIPDIDLLSVTSDPDFDTPEVLKKYMSENKGISKWSFLTGDKAEIQKLTQAFLMSSPDNPEIHSTRFVLIDSSGKIRGFFDSLDPEHMAVLKKSAKQLMGK